jgi:hypothetical protein
MPRVLFLCLTIVAVFSLSAAAATSISEDAPVTADVAALARSVDMDPVRDRARFLPELIRILYAQRLAVAQPSSALPRIALPPIASMPSAALSRVPVPLTADVWSRAIFRRTVDATQLVAAIIGDRRAALLCYSLAALDDETLEYLSLHPAILTRLYEEKAPEFAAFGASVRIRSGRVVPPGGDVAVPLWEGIVGERTDNPERFIRQLFSLDLGRLAYLYDTIAQLDAPNAAFALGLWISDTSVRQARFLALADTCARTYHEWRLDVLPFSKPMHDLAMLLMRIRVGPTGAPLAPAEQSFWTEAFRTDALEDDSVSFAGSAVPDDLIDAAWLMDVMANSDLYWRGDRLDQFSFGQRVFADVPADERADAVVAIRAFPRQRMLSLALERSGIRTPAIYAIAARRAAEAASSNARQFWTLSQLQSGLAHLLRMMRVQSIDQATGEALIRSLCGVPLDENGQYAGAFADWLTRELLPRLPARESAESRMIAALGGAPQSGLSRVEWEGQEYRVDLATAERSRIEIVRGKQIGYSLDLAIDLRSVSRTLESDTLTAAELQRAVAVLSALPDTYGSRFVFQSDVRALGIEEQRPAQERVARAIEELTRLARGRDFRRAARVGATLDDLVDNVLGDVLLSFVYAVELGDPEGPALLARNVALRHDFGFGRRDSEIRRRTIWAVPRRDFLPGVPWHVTGSVLGLDIALAPMSLRRISLDRLSDAPHLSSIDREAFAISVALMEPRQLRDQDRDSIVAAVARGRRRVAALEKGEEPLAPIADAIALDGWRRRAIPWMQQNEPAGISSMFSLVELVMLGGGADEAVLNRWGTTALESVGCACTRMVTPRTWRLLSGRPQMGLMAAGVTDLNLHVALMLAELKLPAALAKSVLSAAVLDFIEDVAPHDAFDWWTVARSAQTIPRDQIEDYVAAAAAVDGPLVPEEPVAADGERQP